MFAAAGSCSVGQWPEEWNSLLDNISSIQPPIPSAYLLYFYFYILLNRFIYYFPVNLKELGVFLPHLGVCFLDKLPHNVQTSL